MTPRPAAKWSRPWLGESASRSCCSCCCSSPTRKVGSSRTTCARSLLEPVDEDEQPEPYHVDEVPVPSHRLEPKMPLRRELPLHHPEPNHRQHDCAERDV